MQHEFVFSNFSHTVYAQTFQYFDVQNASFEVILIFLFLSRCSLKVCQLNFILHVHSTVCVYC